MSPPSVLNASPFTKWVLLEGRPRLYTVYRCGWGFVPVGDNQNLYCQNRQWIGARPKCVKMGMVILANYTSNSIALWYTFKKLI